LGLADAELARLRRAWPEPAEGIACDPPVPG